jgi:hypothetical protein
MTETELKKHLDSAQQSPKQIAAAVSGLPDKVLRYKPSSEKWCILEILGHLADAEIILSYRIRQMLADKDPVIAPIDQDAWAKHLGYLECSPPELVALYGLNRHATVQLLKRLKVEDLEKSAFHPELKGPLTIANMVERLSAHGPNHLQQIERLKKEVTNK